MVQQQNVQININHLFTAAMDSRQALSPLSIASFSKKVGQKFSDWTPKDQHNNNY